MDLNYINNNEDIKRKTLEKGSFSTKRNNLKIDINDSNKEKPKHVQTVNVNLHSTNNNKTESDKNVPYIKNTNLNSKNIIPLSTKNEGTKPKIFQNIQINLKSTSPKASTTKSNLKK